MSEPTYEGFGDGWIIDASDPRLCVLWPDYVTYDEASEDGLAFVLYCARVQCETFAPKLTEDAKVPENYVAAQVLQTRSLIRAGVAGDNGGQSEVGDVVTLFPMDWTVKNLLRPQAPAKVSFGMRRK